MGLRTIASTACPFAVGWWFATNLVSKRDELCGAKIRFDLLKHWVFKEFFSKKKSKILNENEWNIFVFLYLMDCIGDKRYVVCGGQLLLHSCILLITYLLIIITVF